jgi:hypothetical protein
MTTEAAADTGPLSIDAAVALMTAPTAEPDKIEQPAAVEAEQAPAEAAAEPETGGEEEQPESATTDDGAGEAEQPGDGETVEPPPEAAADPVDAPQWWDAEAKAKFAALNPELQAIVRAQEDKRETVVTQAKAQAAEVRKQAESEVNGVKALAEQLSTFVPQAVEMFKTEWENIDWDGWVDRIQNQEDPAVAAEDLLAYNKAVLARDRAQATLQKLKASQTEAEQIARQAFVREVVADLQEHAPELLKPDNQKALGEYIVQSGLPPEAIGNASAKELIVAHKAMLWDQAQAAAKAKAATPAPKPVTPPVRTVAPVAAPAQAANPANREVARLSNRLSQTHSQEDGIALILAMGQKGRGQ